MSDPTDTETPVQKQETQPPTPQATEKPAVSEVAQARKEPEPTPTDPVETAKALLAPHENALTDGGKKMADRCRVVLTAIHAQDGTVLNSKLYAKIKKIMAEKIGCSPALVDKSRTEVLEVKADEDSDAPTFGGGSDTAPVQSPPSTPTGAPFATGPAIISPHSEATLPVGTEPAEADEPMEWDVKKVGTVVKMLVNMPSWGLEEYPRVTSEEEKELGKTFLDVFEEFLPTTKRTGYLLYVGAAIEGLIKPRMTAVINHRFKKMSANEAKEKALKEIRELYKKEGE